MSFSKTHIVLGPIIFAFWIVFAVFVNLALVRAENNEIFAETASSTISSITEITDDAIDSFLFRVSEEVKNKIKELDGKPVEHLFIPVLFDVSVGDFTNSWGEMRSGGRVHSGTDIIAPKGELVVSPTDAVVAKIGYDNQGGNFVITANPGGEQFYFAHLDRAAENLSVGDILKQGDLIGYIGNTGNARGKSPHLHLGIYYKEVARNPFPRLTQEFSAKQKITILEQILAANKVVFGSNNGGVRFLQRFLINKNVGPHAKELAKTGATGYFGPFTKNALAEFQQMVGIAPASGCFGQVTKVNVLVSLNLVSAKQITELSTEAVPEAEIPYSLVLQIDKNLEIGSEGKEVVWLQDFLINANIGSHAKVLSDEGATGYFGILTKNALSEYQLAAGINPAKGYFGPITRTTIKTLGEN